MNRVRMMKYSLPTRVRVEVAAHHLTSKTAGRPWLRGGGGSENVNKNKTAVPSRTNRAIIRVTKNTNNTGGSSVSNNQILSPMRSININNKTKEDKGHPEPPRIPDQRSL